MHRIVSSTARAALGALLAAGVGLAAGPSPAAGQFSEAGLGAGTHVQLFSFQDASEVQITEAVLVTTPVGGRATLWDRLSLELGGSFAYGHVVRPGRETARLSGLTDTSIRASYRVADALTVAAIGRLPTGRTGYSASELDVVGVMASDLFPFRVSSWGAGGGLGGQVTTGGEFGSVGTALSVGYFRAGEFDPIEEQLTSYRPGDNLNVQAVIDAPVGTSGQVALQLGYQWFAEDEIQSTNAFQPGNRWKALSRYSFPVGRTGTGYVYGGYHKRDRGVPLQLLQPSASQQLFLGGGGLRLRAGGVRLRPSIDARLLERADGRSEGYDVRVGGEAAWELGGMQLVPSVHGHLGRLSVREGAESGFIGFDVGVSLRSRQGFP